MIGLGTIINTIAIIVGGLFGYFFGKLLNEKTQDTLTKATGIPVLFIGIEGAMEYMLPGQDNSLTSGGTMLIIACLCIGGFLGELLDIEGKFESFGAWLKIKTGNGNDTSFIDGFVTASLTVCIGAMAIVGAIEDGMSGDYSILAAKSVLDLIIVMVMTCSLGKGCIFSCIPVFLFEGLITLLAVLIKPFMTTLALAYISLVGSILIFCVGINLIWGKKISVANMLPSILVAVVCAFLPIAF